MTKLKPGVKLRAGATLKASSASINRKPTPPKSPKKPYPYRKPKIA